jgi:hypothetical protein
MIGRSETRGRQPARLRRRAAYDGKYLRWPQAERLQSNFRVAPASPR